MSNKKKPKKLRTPNLAAAGVLTSAQARGGGAETTATARPAVATGEPRRVEFDYTYVRQDLRRILLLAGSLVVVLVALSFVLR
jgi:hypothetical protein